MLNSGMIIGDRYEILGKIGSGGMSVVYKGKDQKLNRNVAIKVLNLNIVKMQILSVNSERKHRLQHALHIQIL